MLTIQIPDGLAEKLNECAAKEGVTVDQLLASAEAEKLSALMTLEDLPKRGENSNQDDLAAFLANVPEAPPASGDER